jgi:hypothetical protein
MQSSYMRFDKINIDKDGNITTIETVDIDEISIDEISIDGKSVISMDISSENELDLNDRQKDTQIVIEMESKLETVINTVLSSKSDNINIINIINNDESEIESVQDSISDNESYNGDSFDITSDININSYKAYFCSFL